MSFPFYVLDIHLKGEKDLKTFDELDFVVFSNQELTRLHESHAKDVKSTGLTGITRPA
jgi:hypothetical protein